MYVMKKIVPIVFLSMFSTFANAGFIGSSIEATACYPTLCDTATTIGGPVTKTVGAGTEFSNGEFGAFFGPSFDFDDNSISITHAATGHSSGTFNGYRFVDIGSTIDDIVAVTIAADPSGFFSGDPSRIFFDADTIWVNFESLYFNALDQAIVLNVKFANSSVPEPSPIVLLGLGLMSLLVSRKKKLS
jgi:hypothetical protein